MGNSKSSETNEADNMNLEELQWRNKARQEGFLKNYDVKEIAITDEDLQKAVGIENIGNSCYISSVLQCMRQVNQLSTFCLSGSWKVALNLFTQMGSEGRLLREYVVFLSAVQGCKEGSSVDPSKFKTQLAQANNMVS